MNIFDTKICFFILMFATGLFLHIYWHLRNKKVLELKKSFLFEIDEFKDLIIQAVSGDEDNLKFWIKSWCDDLTFVSTDNGKKPAWYVMANNTLCCKAREHLKIAQSMIKSGNYYHAVGVLEENNRIIMEYEISTR